MMKVFALLIFHHLFKNLIFMPLILNMRKKKRNGAFTIWADFYIMTMLGHKTTWIGDFASYI